MTSPQSVSTSPRLISRPAILGLMLLLSLVGRICGQSLTPGVDANTVAFWAFDEPQYLNMPLLDAGVGEYDLRLRAGGRMVPGKFGNALEISSQTLPATMFAEVGGNLFMPDLTSRPVENPTGIIDALHGLEWTWEGWVKFKRAPSGEVALWHLSQNGANTFYCGLISNGGTFVMRDWVDNLNLWFPITSGNLTNGQWHHVALVKSAVTNGVRDFTLYSESNTTARQVETCSTGWPGRQVGNQRILHQLYVDGVRQGAPEVASDADPGLTGGGPDWSNGLIGVLYGSESLVRPSTAEQIQMFDYDFSPAGGSGWSKQWFGWLDPPTTGQINFRAEADWGIRLYINGALIMNGWGPTTIRTGNATFTKGVKVPINVQFQQSDRPNPRIKLYWSWPGHAEELVPAGTFSFTPDNARQVAAILNYSTGTTPRAFEMRVGTTVAGLKPLDGLIDELRFSKTARYEQDAPPPASLSYNYAVPTPAPAVATGPPLLFASDVTAPDPLTLGSNKHLFIDDALLASKQNLTIASNPWTGRQKIQPRFGGDSAVVDTGSQIYIYQANGDMWNGGLTEALHAAVLLYTSNDGLTFTAPNLRLFEFNGTLNNSVVIKAPVQGSFFVDNNPNTPAAARYKFTSLTMSYGQILYYSADGIHWKRNETVIAPFDCGGGVESFWDDQRGQYCCYIRNEGWQTYASLYTPNKASALTRSREPFKSFPFTPYRNPRAGLGIWTMPSMSFELPTVIRTDGRGQVFRARPLKYEWAPDAYFAFVWRGIGQDWDEFFTGDLGVSRDGVNWTYFDPWYMNYGEDLGSGETVTSVAPICGLIRRGDDLWNYALLTTTPTNSKGGMYRYKQRLDGYVSLNAGATLGTATSRTFTFTGTQLKLNANATGGSIKVGLVNANGTAIPGFALANCTPISSDGVATTVSWSGGSLAALAGTPVKLQFEMQNAKLFALQFMP